MNLKTKVVQREKKYAKDLTGANVLQVTDVTMTTDAWDVENGIHICHNKKGNGGNNVEGESNQIANVVSSPPASTNAK